MLRHRREESAIVGRESEDRPGLLAVGLSVLEINDVDPSETRVEESPRALEPAHHRRLPKSSFLKTATFA
jgi:hypothetical protein